MRRKSFLYLLLVCLLLLNACSEPLPNEGGGTVAESAATEEPENSVHFLKDGAAVFDLIYPKESKFSKVSAWVKQIENAVQRYTGATLRSYTDLTPSKGRPMILLGDTNHAESNAAFKALGKGGYSVTLKGDCIVINASDEQAMVKAVNWFCNVLLKKTVISEDQRNAVLSFEEKLDVGVIMAQAATVNGAPLKSFTVVYPAGNEICGQEARRFASYSNDLLGIPLKVTDDFGAASEWEILFGNTNRAESAEHYAALSLAPMDYECAVINGKISVLAYRGNGYGLCAAAKGLIDQITEKENGNMENGLKMKRSAMLKEDTFSALAEGANVRVMTANLLSEEWGGTACMPRGEVFYANLLYYGVDVAGIQEISREWTSTLKLLLNGTDYALLHDVVKGTDSNYCPIVYNTKTLELLESDAYRLAIGGPGKARTVTWGVFKHRETQKVFIVLNTHLDWIADANDYETTGVTSHYSREQQVREIAGTYAALQVKYPNVDIMMTADWNTARHKHPLDILCDLTEAVFAEDLIGKNDWPAYEVDHVLVSEGTAVKTVHCYYHNGKDLGATDHPWGFADIKLK